MQSCPRIPVLENRAQEEVNEVSGQGNICTILQFPLLGLPRRGPQHLPWCLLLSRYPVHFRCGTSVDRIRCNTIISLNEGFLFLFFWFSFVFFWNERLYQRSDFF